MWNNTDKMRITGIAFDLEGTLMPPILSEQRVRKFLQQFPKLHTPKRQDKFLQYLRNHDYTVNDYLISADPDYAHVFEQYELLCKREFEKVRHAPFVAIEVLRKLQSRPVSLAIYSNSTHHYQPSLDKLFLGAFDGIVVRSSDCHALKHTAEFLTYAATQLGQPFSQTLSVDDSLKNCFGADTVGMHPFFYNTGEYLSESKRRNPSTGRVVPQIDNLGLILPYIPHEDDVGHTFSDVA